MVKRYLKIRRIKQVCGVFAGIVMSALATAPQAAEATVAASPDVQAKKGAVTAPKGDYYNSSFSNFGRVRRTIPVRQILDPDRKPPRMDIREAIHPGVVPQRAAVLERYRQHAGYKPQCDVTPVSPPVSGATAST